MLTKERALELVCEGHSYEEAARLLGVSPGLVYLAATGVAADESDGLSEEDLARPGLLTSAQCLSNPRVEQPDRRAHVRAFLAGLARQDPTMAAAAAVARTASATRASDEP